MQNTESEFNIMKSPFDKYYWISIVLIIFIATFSFLLQLVPAEALEPPIVLQVEMLDWFSDEAQQYIDKTNGIWKRETSATVVDMETGLYFSASRNGGWNHADWEPETSADTAIVKAIYRGEWSWDRRPVLVQIGDKTFAASMNGMPHGGNRIKGNDYDGHSCIHFLHSKLHVSAKEDERHQSAVLIAYNTLATSIQELISLHSTNPIPNLKRAEKLAAKGE